MLPLKTELEQRGFLNQYTDEAVFELYDQGKQSLYVGMDPTADSLHLGNFVGFMHAVQYMKRANHLIFIVGGATGMVGDPGGKNAERSFLDEETLEANVQAITKQVGTILEHLKKLSGHEFSFEVVNNLDFYQDMSYIRFLRDIGKYITVNNMMTKDTVKRRIEDPDASISYTEFSYMLMQGFDFLHLYENNLCKLQIAGSDQRGNIVTGIELIRKKLDQTAYGVTCPLIVDSSGKKFGKSEGNAIRLDPNKNSPYYVYQYFLNTADEDVERYLKLLTLLEFEQIQNIVSEHQKDTAQRHGQRELAKYVVTTVFGEKAAEQAEIGTEFFFGSKSKVEILREEEKKGIDALFEFSDFLHKQVGGLWIHGYDMPKRVIDLCTETGLTSSNSEAKKQIKAGSIYINEEKVTDIGQEVTQDEFIGGKTILIGKGKKKNKIVIKR